VRRNAGLLVIIFRGFGSVVLSAKCVGQCGLFCRLPSPTIRPREQADHARYRSFVVSRCGFGFDGHGLVDRLSRDGCVAVFQVGRALGLVGFAE